MWKMIMVLLLSGCSIIEPKIVKKPPFDIPPKNIQLREYKDIKPFFIEDNICYSKDDYLKTLYMLNDLKHYIQYQKELTQQIKHYYEN